MTLKIWLVLIYGFVNYTLRIRAEVENNTCAAHETWTVFQRRKYGNVGFNRVWVDYVSGFGNCDGDFWLGLEALHQATKENDMSLEINMMSKGKKDHLWAKYRNFYVGPAARDYILVVSGFSGNAGDAFKHLYYNYYFGFSTKDVDNSHEQNDCDLSREGGWWYAYCGESNLNGSFNKTGVKGVSWRRQDDIMCCSEMKIYKRP